MRKMAFVLFALFFAFPASVLADSVPLVTDSITLSPEGFPAGQQKADDNADNAYKLETDGQLLLTYGRTFGVFLDEPAYSLGFYGHGTFTYSLLVGPMLQLYLGPDLSLLCTTADSGKVCDLNLKLLTGALFTPDADGSVDASSMLSFWFSLNNLLVPNLQWVAQYDQYIAISHPEAQFYAFSTLIYSPLPGEFGLGLATEHFGGFNDSWIEAAVGLVMNYHLGQLYACYDFTPDLPGDTIWFRLQVNL